MTKTHPRLKIRQIRRKQILTTLAIAAVLAILVARCSTNAEIDINKGITDENANEPIDAVFYQNTAQCAVDMKKQQDEYAVLQKRLRSEDEDEPTPPPMQVADCAAQMLAAQQEHDKTAPVYASIADCQSEGVRCEATPAGALTAGYRPIYGGTYLYPYSESNWIYINHSGYQHRVYETRPVYQSINAGRVVTAYGREISQVTTGRVTVPRHTTVAAPSRPSGTTAQGTIKGRSSQGFGSSFKSTGSGGK